MYEASYTWCRTQVDIGERYPIDFLKDYVVESGRIHSEDGNQIIKEAFKIKARDRPSGHYHQEAASSPGKNAK